MLDDLALTTIPGAQTHRASRMLLISSNPVPIRRSNVAQVTHFRMHLDIHSTLRRYTRTSVAGRWSMVMSSEQTTQRDGSFVVRIWWEPGADPGTRYWRGWIQHVRNDKQISFQNVADLLAFIERETGIQAMAEQATQGLG
jgi:hypothetical protein